MIQTAMTLEEYLEHSGEAWFLTGKKEHAVQAMMVSGETSFHNNLEMVDYTVSDDSNTVILKGSFGEKWAAKLSKVTAAYVKPDGGPLSEEDFAVKDKYIDIITQPKPDQYCAMHVPMGITLTAETAGGHVLHANSPGVSHGDGDYIICRADENGDPDLSDIWIINGVVFPEYYDTKTISRW